MNKKLFGYGIYSLWISYGATRAIDEKNFENQNRMKRLEEEYKNYQMEITKKELETLKNKDTIIVDKGLTCLSGMFVYANPLMFPLLAYKELYRLEINLRGLNHLKNETKYHSLI